MKALVIVAALICGSCGLPQTDDAAKAQVEAAKICKDHGGIPIVDKDGMYQRCEALGK